MCWARYCRACVKKHVRLAQEQSIRRYVHYHEVGHRFFDGLLLDDPSATADLGMVDTSQTYGTLDQSRGVLVLDDRTYPTYAEAAADSFAWVVIDPLSLAPSTARWVRRNLSVLGHEDIIAPARSDLDATVPTDKGREYQCQYCGHLWHELNAPVRIGPGV